MPGLKRESRLMLRRGVGAFLVFCALATTPAMAVLPDPVEFGIAVERGDLRSVRRWLDEGMDPEFQADRIGTGLMLAAWTGNIELMTLFVERGANLRRANRNGEQAVQLAAWGGHEAAVHWLLERGAVLNREGMNWNALHYAVFNGHDKLASQLIERGANVNARSPNGSTPLMLAAREGREDMAKILIDAGADPRVRNDWGDTALTLAMRYDHYRLGKVISTAEEFAVAIKAPKESFGEVSRSASAPSAIDGILQKMRASGADSREVEDLRKQLFAAVASFKRESTPSAQNARRPAPRPYQPGSLVITAKRGQPGAERAEVLPAVKSVEKSNAKPVAGGARETVSPAQVSELLRQIRLAEAQGQATDELRQQLQRALDALTK